MRNFRGLARGLRMLALDGACGPEARESCLRLERAIARIRRVHRPSSQELETARYAARSYRETFRGRSFLDFQTGA